MNEDLLREQIQRPLQVSELIEAIRETLAVDFGDLWVEGEVGSLYRSRLGHLYFDLKDPEGQLRSVVFRRHGERLAVEPEEGMQVTVHARADLYAERGSLQLIVDHIEPTGAGALRLAFERLKARLQEEGLFDVAHKQAVPFLPRRIGLVTSRHGAAMQDFVQALRRRGAPVEIVLCDARVQGEGAWREVVRGLHLLDRTVDVIVLARGGGSIEDLWTFNREEVVRAVFEAETPIVSAIGHEVDWVLTDLVADVRAATPTAAAEAVTPDALELSARVEALARRLNVRQAARLRELRGLLEALRRGVRHPGQRLAELRGRLDGMAQRMTVSAKLGCERGRARFRRADERLLSSMPRLMEQRRASLASVGGRLDALSPLAVLGRGYSITWREPEGLVLKESDDVAEGSPIRVQLWRGSLRATVTASIRETS
ncbi:MAG: exodeoxyribonuclease VII large subunit [Myxococcota bacterium]